MAEMSIAVPERLWIPSGSQELSARVFTPSSSERTVAGVLFVHGLHSDQVGYQARAERLTEQLGLSCLTFDLGGHGESTGTLDHLTPLDHLGDVLAAYDALSETIDGQE